ncbi:MAG: hypothetical protein HY902_05015 [Deltaproteobacteria bacterium]|nr:hypothetical protein [Deltaproteobacteria bacterium]
MRGLAALAVAATLGLAQPAAADDWTGADKAAHFGFSLAFGAAATAVVPAAGGSSGPQWQPLALGFGLGLVPGAAKEGWDLVGRGDPSWKDLAWNVAGSLVGAGIVWAAQSLLTPRATPAR